MTVVRGFRLAGVAAGIKKRGGLDLGLIVSDEPVPTAAVFTRNLVRAHPVHVSERRVLSSEGAMVACLVNSGCANACSGEAGLEATLATTAEVARLLGVDAERVLPSSTGVIGQVLPTEKVRAALPALVAALRPDGLEDFAAAIMTTDRWKKLGSTTLEGTDEAGRPATATVLCVGKGAGMFHPDLAPAGQLPQPNGSGFLDPIGMDLAGIESVEDLGKLHATMLVYILTDALADVATLRAALEYGADQTFNSATVDGDTSTNDSVYLMASGRSGLRVGVEELTRALVEACRPVVRSMVRDGEGAEHVVDICVRGVESDAAARDIARTIATSPLVKTALTGKDANWGRLLAAAGRAGVPFDPSRAGITIGGVCICRDGGPTDAEADRRASEQMQADEYTIEVTLGDGPGRFTYVTADLGHGYVDVNAGYRS
jgi:glutamate N-acetyltransferase/amino-acid N-acetyltransferase